jgi:hypothetical protein
MISHGKADNITLPEILSKISESEILYHYLGIKDIPCVINSPLREDRNPSFGLYSIDGEHIYYRDFSTKETGNIFTLLKNLWGINFQEVLNRIQDDLIKNNYTTHTIVGKPTKVRTISNVSDSKLDVKVRDWRDYDLEYWGSYGITLDWLKWADVYPISYIIITKEGKKYTFPAEKHAYCFVEYKEGNVTLKVYQPLTKDRHKKWYNKHDRSVVSLWTKIPEYGDKVVICSSLKDALTLSANTGIPALAIQSEGNGMSETAIKELERRFTKQYICLDNDKTGIDDGFKLSLATGFTNLVIPLFEGGKDLSDFRQLFGKDAFVQMIKNLFKYDT